MSKLAYPVTDRHHAHSGYQQTQETLERVSAAKSELDEQKGRTLEDISMMVKDIGARIEAKRSSLAPLVTALRDVRHVLSPVAWYHFGVARAMHPPVSLANARRAA